MIVLIMRRALHRSPQDWSSYNGYVSDASEWRPGSLHDSIDVYHYSAQLCFALNGRRQTGESSCSVRLPRMTDLITCQSSPNKYMSMLH